jgi:predicted secreted protein
MEVDMQKQLLMATGVMLLTIAFGCSSSVVIETVTTTLNETVVIDEVISVESGQEFTIPLLSNPSTGYTWRETHDTGLLALVVYQPKQPPSTGGPIIVGGGGTDNFRFKALVKGKGIIVFEYYGPGAVPGGSQAAQKKTIEFEVKK